MSVFKKDNLKILAFFSGICFLYTVSLSHINVKIGAALPTDEHLRLYILECLSMGLGFLCCPVLLNKPDGGKKWRRMMLILSLIFFLITTFILHFVTTGPVMRLSVVYEILSMGLIAGYGYVIVSNRANKDPLIGPVVAGAYSIAILSQFVLQLELNLGLWLTVLESVICLLVVLHEIHYTGAFEDEDQDMSGAAQTDQTVYKGTVEAQSIKELRPKGGLEFIRLIVIATCLLVLSSYVDEQMSVTIDVSQYFTWSRLMFVPGCIFMGLAWSHKRARIAPVVMLLSAVVAFLMPVLLTDEAYYGLDICVFYFYIGICMTYLTLTFMKYADLSGNSFAAVTFRVLDNILTVVFVLLGLGTIPAMAMIVADVILLVLIVALMWLGGDFEPVTKYERLFISEIASENNKMSSDILDDERIRQFAEKYGLSERESETLKLLLTKDEKGEVMAKELGVSRRGFVSFTTSIYQKTETGSRIGLMQKFMSE